jgi:hypothetical protein
MDQKIFKKSALILVGTFCLGITALVPGHCSKEETQEGNEKKPQAKTITVNPNESDEVTQKKKKGILEANRDYTEKSGFVEARDEVEGRAKKMVEGIKDAFK